MRLSIATTGGTKLAGLAAAGLMMLSTQVAVGQSPPPPDRPEPPPQWGPPGRPGQPPQATQISGTVQSYNLGPRGNVEGLMIKAGDRTAQINLPPEVGPLVTGSAAIGAQVQINAIPQPGMSDHPVYDFHSMALEGGRQLELPSPKDRKLVHIDSTVKSLNYGRRGEVNGIVLDNGDFVQLGPEARQLNLQVGTKLVVDGIATPMLASEHRVIQAIAVNGTVIQPPPPGPAARPGPRPADDQRPPAPEDRRGPRGARDGQAPPPPPQDESSGGPQGDNPPPPPHE